MTRSGPPDGVPVFHKIVLEKGKDVSHSDVAVQIEAIEDSIVVLNKEVSKRANSTPVFANNVVKGGVVTCWLRRSSLHFV